MKKCDVCGGKYDRRCARVCKKLKSLDRTNQSAREFIVGQLVTHGPSKRRFRFTIEQEKEICESYTRDPYITMPQIGRRWSTTPEGIRGVLMRNKIPIRRWCLRKPVIKVRVAFSRAKVAMIPVQGVGEGALSNADVVRSTNTPSESFPIARSSYVPYPALASGRCVGCGTPLEATNRVCDACEVAGL